MPRLVLKRHTENFNKGDSWLISRSKKALPLPHDRLTWHAEHHQNLRWINVTPASSCFPIEGECPSTEGGRGCVRLLEGIMKLLRTTALTAALITAAVPLLTNSAQAWRGWRGGGWGWRGAALGAAAVGTALAARSYYGGYGGYGTGYNYPAYGYGYRPGIVRRGLYAAAWRRWH